MWCLFKLKLRLERALKIRFSGWIQMIKGLALLAKESGVCPEGSEESLWVGQI